MLAFITNLHTPEIMTEKRFFCLALGFRLPYALLSLIETSEVFEFREISLRSKTSEVLLFKCRHKKTAPQRRSEEQ